MAERQPQPSATDAATPFSSVGRGRCFHETREFYYMKDSISTMSEQEPMGIVISRGSRQEATPMFFAYVWAPAPEDTDPLDAQVA